VNGNTERTTEALVHVGRHKGKSVHSPPGYYDEGNLRHLCLQVWVTLCCCKGFSNDSSSDSDEMAE
jgi:hypothetical protein